MFKETYDRIPFLATMSTEPEQLKQRAESAEALCAELRKAGETLYESRFSHGLSQRESEEKWKAALAKTPADMGAELKRLRAIGDPCSLADAAAKPKDSLSLIHQYDANACCVTMDTLRQQLAERDAELKAYKELAESQRQLFLKNEAGAQAEVARLKACIEAGDGALSSVQQEAAALRARVAELEALINAALAALPVGNLRTHTPETIPARITDLVTAFAEANEEVEKAEARNARLVAAAQRALHAMRMNNWHWDSEASDDMKRGAAKALHAALADNGGATVNAEVAKVANELAGETVFVPVGATHPDTARLDWLEQNGLTFEFFQDSIRRDIDAAMQAKEDGR